MIDDCSFKVGVTSLFSGVIWHSATEINSIEQNMTKFDSIQTFACANTIVSTKKINMINEAFVMVPLEHQFT